VRPPVEAQWLAATTRISSSRRRRSRTRTRLCGSSHPKIGYLHLLLAVDILVDCMGFSPIGLRSAIEMYGVDRVVFGSDYVAVPYRIKEHVQIVEDVLPSPAERQLVFWKTSNKIFRLGLIDTDLVTPALHQSR
jgi:hypothetical protein